MQTGRVHAAAAALAASLAAWLSQGTLAFAVAGGPRIALLPLEAAPLLVSIGAGFAVARLARAGAPLTPVSLLAFVALPWLPLPVPAAFLIWAGPLTLLVWTAVLWNMARGAGLHATVAVPAPTIRAGLLALLIFGLAAWRVAPSLPDGDEPHYLVITQSLLYDGDLKIENNHRRRDYQVYVSRDLRPDYLRRGRDGEIYSIHAPGISAVVAPAFALAGYPGTVVFLVLISAAGSVLLWHVLWMATANARATWFGWAAVTLSSTAIFQSFTVYPDGAGGLLALTGIWGVLRADAERRSGSTRIAPWWLHGAALALLPWLHSRFALLAGSLGALILLRLGAAPNPAAKAAALLTIPAVSALGWIGYFVAIYGTPDPSAPYGLASLGSPANIPGGLSGLLFDQRFGLIATAPVLMFGLFGFVTMLWCRPAASVAAAPGAGEPVRPAGSRRLALELLFIALPYLLTVTNFTMWWGGWSAPARFATPILPVLAITCAFAWMAIRHRATKTVAVGSLVLTAFVSAVLIIPEQGRLAFSTRVAPARWLEWASPLGNLPQGVPDWFREPQSGFAGDVAVWLTAMGAGWVMLRWMAGQRALRRRATLATAAVALYVSLAMLSLTILWNRHDVSGVTATPAQMAYLRMLAREPRGAALQVSPPRRLERERIPSMMRIRGEPLRQAVHGAGPDDGPFLALPAVPAGTYRIRPRARAAGGSLMVGITDDEFALITGPVRNSTEPLLIDFPVDVRALVVRGDERARQTVRRVDVEPVSLRGRASPLTRGFAHRAVRHGPVSIFFLDDRSYAEPESFWVGGSVSSRIVVQPDAPVESVSLLLRNAPVTNDVTVAAGPYRESMQLAPGETRMVTIPFDRTLGTVVIRFDVSSGFRPSEIDPESQDGRFLGLWVQVEGYGEPQNLTTPPT